MKKATRSADLMAAQLPKGRVPSVVTFQVTDRCNYECSHCYQEHINEDELSTAEIDGVLEQLADAGVLFLNLMGGEFFMRRDAEHILTRAHELGFVIKLFTTGHHIHDRRADFLATIRPLQVDISVYGANAAAHEFVTNQAGSWQRSIDAVKRLVERKIPVVLKTPVMAANLDQVESIQALAKELGADFTFDPKVTAVQDGDTSSTMLRMTGAQSASFYRNQVSDFIDASFKDAHSEAEERRPLSEAPCRAGVDLCSINPRGEVWPCNSLPFPVGDLRKESFSSIWATSPKMQEVRDLRWAAISECRECKVRTYCSRCSGMALVEHGDMRGPSLEACRQAVAIRDSLRDRGVIPATDVAMPPTWDRVHADGLHHTLDSKHRGRRSSSLRVLS